MMLFGAIEMGRLLWTWNAAAEATRLGARMAVVCSMNESNIVTRMRQRLPYLASNNVSIVYAPPGCTEADCDLVRVTITGYSHQTIIPGINLLPVMPPFQTTLTKEFMQSSGNPVCGNP